MVVIASISEARCREAIEPDPETEIGIGFRESREQVGVDLMIMVKRLTWLLVVAGLCVSCQKFAEGRQMFRELLALRDQIAAEFHEKVVDVSIANGNRMRVKFVNSPLSSRSHEEKQQRADAVAAFVAKHYTQPLSSVSIQFVSQTGGGGVSVSVGESYVGRLPKP
jgi:hypothetical protein